MRTKNYMLEEWSDCLSIVESTESAGILLVSTTALLTSPVPMPASESEFDRKGIVHTLHSCVFKYKSGGKLWQHRLDVVTIKVHVHTVVAFRLHAVVNFGLMGADS
jgi:hypothetical protein